MMVDFKWIQIYLFLVTLLQFTAAAEQHPPSFTVRVGGDVTLSCENVIDGQQNCDGTSWVFSVFSSSVVKKLITLGQIDKEAESKSDRLSVTENCSLVIKKVTVQDVGRYYCQQYKSGQHQDSDSQLLLSVVTMSLPAPVTEPNYVSVVTLSCSVSAYEPCSFYSVKWLYDGQDVDKQNVTTRQSPCSAAVNFPTSHHIYTSNFKSLKCEVTDANKVKFTFSPQPEKPGEETTTTQSTTTTTGTTGNSMKAGQWWLIVVVLVAVAALLILVVVAVVRRKRTKRNKRHTDENTESFVAEESNGLSPNPAVTPGTSQDAADPEDGVSYASVSYTKTTTRKTQARGKDDDDDDEAVTYSTVKPSSSSSSAGASADPGCLYATVN